jgi:flavin-dependent dehydrogenase
MRLFAAALFLGGSLHSVAALTTPHHVTASKATFQPRPTSVTRSMVETIVESNIGVPNVPKEPVVFGSGLTMTERMLSKVPIENQVGGAGGVSTLDAFKRVEANWERIKAFESFKYDPKLFKAEQNGKMAPKPFVTNDGAMGNPKCWQKLKDSCDKELDYDVVVCGGTLGIFFATYLQLQGHQVCVVEAGNLRGREQEWNISMDELEELLKLGVLNQEDVDAVITTEFPACRSGFKNKEVTPLEGGYFDNNIGYECMTPDVLNLGVAPAMLLERVSKRFVAIGGKIRERTPLRGLCVSESVGSAIDLGDGIEPITARLVLDCMGNASPISSQQRYGVKPDGICAVVGSCAGGYDATDNKFGDIIYTNTPTVTRDGKGSNQYFWEAFPVGIGRNGQTSSDVKTTYMFTYMDADSKRISMFDLMEDYWKLLPEYQPSIKNPEQDLDIKRILFAYFPTYRDAPLKPSFSRVLAVGDASGIQSPLSFGGFGALTRHLSRVGRAISEALDSGCLHKDDLGEINAYQPNLSAAWMFQKAMSMKVGSKPNPVFVNRLLATNFQVMNEMGFRTIKPFLQDVVRLDGLAGSLARSFVADPLFMPQIVATVGLPELVEWLGHVGNMAAYTVLDAAVSPVIRPFVDRIGDAREKFRWRRRMDAWKYGCGADYVLPEDDEIDLDFQ